MRPRDGATRQIPLLRALRLNNDQASVGELREWSIVNVFATPEEAQAHNRRLKRAMIWKAKANGAGSTDTMTTREEAHG